MDTEEFAKFWVLLLNLFPAAASKKSWNIKKVWELAMSPYDLSGATEAAVEYARSKKFFLTFRQTVPNASECERSPQGKGKGKDYEEDKDQGEKFCN